MHKDFILNMEHVLGPVISLIDRGPHDQACGGKERIFVGVIQIDLENRTITRYSPNYDSEIVEKLDPQKHGIKISKERATAGQLKIFEELIPEDLKEKNYI